MTISKKQKRWLIISGIVLAFLLAVMLSVNFILASIIHSKITNVLKNNPDKNYHITLERVGVNILNGNVNFKELKIEPDSVFLEQLKRGELKQSMVLRASVPLFRLAGFDLYDFLDQGDIRIRKILIKDADVQLIVGKKPKKKPKEQVEDKPNFRFDSIQIKGVTGIEIGKFELKSFKMEVYDIVKNEVISENKKLNIDISGVESVKLQGEGDYFAFHFNNGELNLSEEELNLPGGNYKISLKNMKLNLSDSSLVITGFVLKPQIKDRFAMAKKLVYTTGIFNVSATEIRLSDIDIVRMLDKGELVIKKVDLVGLNIDIFKDKRKPWNKELRPKYPNQALREMDFPIFIGTIETKGAYLKYHEQSEKTFGNLMVTLDDMELFVSHATSMKDSSRKPMIANMRANLFKTAPMTVDFRLPLNSRVDTFFVSGSLGKAPMSKFNPALFPALGMKILGGTLNSVVFEARANRRYIDGEMVMMYDGLETEMMKKNDKDINKFMSWLANSVARKSNPGKNAKLRTVPMHFDRDMYKGFINIAWKGVQTGLVNTVSPAGKAIKEEKKPRSSTNKKSAKKSTQKSKDSSATPSKREQRKKKRDKKKRDKK